MAPAAAVGTEADALLPAARGDAQTKAGVAVAVDRLAEADAVAVDTGGAHLPLYG
jgi:hypothetical protein